MTLFNGQSTREYFAKQISGARASIQSLNDRFFSDGSLEPTKEKLLKDARIEFPVLQVDQKKGKRVVVEERGGRVSVGSSRTMIEVTIPFTGGGEAFILAPSTRTIGVPGEVSGKAIVITLPDDASLEKDLAEAVSQIHANLGHFRNDYRSFEAEIRAVMDRTAAAKIEEIERKRELDSKRSFPIE